MVLEETLWILSIGNMNEHDPFLDDLPMKNDDFHSSVQLPADFIKSGTSQGPSAWVSILDFDCRKNECW